MKMHTDIDKKKGINVTFYLRPFKTGSNRTTKGLSNPEGFD